MPGWTKGAKAQVLKHEKQQRTYGISKSDQMVLVKPEKKGYLPALELANEDIKNVTKFVFPQSRFSPFFC
jgi:hypothetical protein